MARNANNCKEMHRNGHASAKAMKRMPCKELPRTVKKKPSNSKKSRAISWQGMPRTAKTCIGKAKERSCSCIGKSLANPQIAQEMMWHHLAMDMTWCEKQQHAWWMMSSLTRHDMQRRGHDMSCRDMSWHIVSSHDHVMLCQNPCDAMAKACHVMSCKCTR